MSEFLDRAPGGSGAVGFEGWRVPGLTGAGTEAAGHRGADFPPGQAELESGGGEFVAHGVVVEVAGADELSEGEGGPVEGVVAAAGQGGADPSDLGGERRAGPWSGGGGAGP